MFPKQKNKPSNELWVHSTALFTLIALFLGVHLSVSADELDDRIDEICEDMTEEECEDFREEVDAQEDEFDSLENQLKNAERLAELKKQQAKTYANQVEILNLEISGIQSNINSLTKEILSTQEKIDILKREIEKKEKSIKENQVSLGEMLRNYYKSNQELGISLISRENSLSNVFTRSDNLSQISTKINNILKIIREEKTTLDREKESHETEKSKLDNQKSELSQERKAVAIQKNEKNSLLNRTKGEEAEYRALINRIESRMKELLIDVGSLSAAEESEINEILEDADEPEEGKASTKWYYSQRDSKWRNDSIGGTSLTVGDFGCALTSVAMVFTYHDEDVEPDDIAEKNSYFYSGLMDWGDGGLLSRYDMELKVRTGHSTSYVDWDDIEDYIDDDELPVIVFIKGSGSKGHYVVIHGYDDENDDFVVHDPYWGPNLLLGTSKKIIKSIYGSASVDQMIVYKPD